jgi:hypothetical protein
MIPFPRNEIRDEETALDWWEGEFARACEAIGAQADAAALTRSIVASLRDIRRAFLERRLTLIEAAERTGYTPDHIGRLVRTGRLRNVGRKNAPRVLAGDLQELRSNIASTPRTMYDTETDARSLVSARR